MAEHGGYRTPSHPAPVSGPGAHSARTDRGPKQHDITGGSYGSSQEFQQQQSAAPLSPPAGSPGSTAPSGLDPSALTGLSAPTTMPGIPVTDGAAEGAGVGPEAMFGKPVDPNTEDARALGKYLPVMVQVADSDGATPGFKKYVRQILASL
jgi:hypothetical protein